MPAAKGGGESEGDLTKMMRQSRPSGKHRQTHTHTHILSHQKKSHSCSHAALLPEERWKFSPSSSILLRNFQNGDKLNCTKKSCSNSKADVGESCLNQNERT